MLTALTKAEPQIRALARKIGWERRQVVEALEAHASIEVAEHVPVVRVVASRSDMSRPVVHVPKQELVRHEGYRRLVAARPCKRCGIEQYTQAAHVNSGGKGTGLKADDRFIFPACTVHPGPGGYLVAGCHEQFDQYQLASAEASAEMGMQWARETAHEIRADGNWPADLAWPKEWG